MNRIKSLFFVFVLHFSLFICISADQKTKANYLETANLILNKGLKESNAFKILKKITNIGPRLSGSPQAAAAVELTQRLMEDMKFDNIHIESTTVPRWERGEIEEAKILSATFGTIPLSIASIGASIATPPEGITAEVLEVKTFEELARMKDKARGKIIFFNRPLDPTNLNTFSAYGAAANQRVQGAVKAAQAGGIAAIVRSLTTSLDDFPHTGLMVYDPDILRIPAACVSTIGADTLSNMLKQDPTLRLYIKLNCHNFPPVRSYNVIGQITGSRMSNEIILIGGHLDSWDLGPGAHDDGAGCAQSLEALRLIKELELIPHRTIRAVMFMNEEFGGSGGRDYASSEHRRDEKHVAAIESDRGGFLPLGFGAGNTQTVKPLKKWEYLLKKVGMQWIRPGGGGVDIGPLGEKGTLLIGLVPDSQRYFDLHHSSKDTLDTVNPRELELGAISMALLAYVLAQEGIDE